MSAEDAEKLLDGIVRVKSWFSLSRSEPRARFVIRQVDPGRRWKLPRTGLASLVRWTSGWPGWRHAQSAVAHRPREQ
ncbi:hypothetical protein P9869_24415 [Streptomyces ossamyceticus]|nr:hypothetical protein [Streptomyces ossamyceticus]